MKKFTILLLASLSLLTIEARDIKRVACIGNGITSGSWLATPDRDSYPSALGRMLGDGYQVTNLGKSGATLSPSAPTYYPNSNQYKQLESLRPDIITVMLGASDASTDQNGSIIEMNTGLRRFAKMLKGMSWQPRVIFVSPTKAWTRVFRYSDDLNRQRVKPMLEEVAKANGFEYVDMYAATENDPDSYPDGVHPDVNGAGHIAAVLYKAITGKQKQWERPLSLPTLFTDHAVLQQNTDVAIWGWAAAGKEVTVKPDWGKAVKAKADAKGCWRVRIHTLKASFDKHAVTISQGGQRIVLRDVLFGEVWLAAGQSNMQMELGGFYRTVVKGGMEAVMNSSNDGLRLFRVPRSDAARAYDDVPNKGWEVSSPASSVHFSATGYFFGHNLQKALGVPVGIIQSAYGGASIVAFMSPDAIEPYKQHQIAEYMNFQLPAVDEKYTWAKHTPSVIYNTMIHPLLTYNIKGAIWYQGCDDRRNPQLYKEMFHTFLNDYHKKWQCGNWPIYYAQIAPFGYKDNTAAFMREAQEQVESAKDSMFMICLMDNGIKDNIHPDDKATVGLRFANRVLDKTYHIEGIQSDYPHYKSMEVRKDGKVVIRFTGMDDGVAKKTYRFKGFKVAGEDRVFHDAIEAKDEGSTIVVTPPAGVKPVAVRYCFEDYAEGGIYNLRGLPLSSFRTDNWEE